MSTAVPAVRSTLRSCTPHLRLQRRWARVNDVRFVTTDGDAGRTLDKYKIKLEQKAKQEGYESISSLKEAYQDKINSLRNAATTIPLAPQSPPKSSLTQPPPPPPQPQPEARQSLSQQKSSSAVPGIRPLSSYLDLDKVSALPPKEVEYLWRLRHAGDKLSLCAVIPLETYNRICQTARNHPQFILPLPRPATSEDSGVAQQSPSGFEGGARSAADIHFLQWGFHPAAGASPGPEVQTSNTHTSTVVFTHLAAYKLHGSFAPPHTTITHHLDLVDSHNIVLLNGSVIDGQGVSVEEGRWLLMCLQKFYDFEGHGGGVGKEKRQGLLEKFSKGDNGFKLEELVAEAERIS